MGTTRGAIVVVVVEGMVWRGPEEVEAVAVEEEEAEVDAVPVQVAVVVEGDRRRWREASGEMQIGEKAVRLGRLGYFSGGRVSNGAIKIGISMAHHLGMHRKHRDSNGAPSPGAPLLTFYFFWIFSCM